MTFNYYNFHDALIKHDNFFNDSPIAGEIVVLISGSAKVANAAITIVAAATFYRPGRTS